MTRAVLALSLLALAGCKQDPCPEDDQKTFYADADGDGFGSTEATLVACDATVPAGFIADNTDCDDLDANSFPGNAEVCDHVDNDCDGAIDGDNATGKQAFFADVDGDGYGDPDVIVESCDLPATGAVTNDADCNDAKADVSPEGTESCDGEDNDCNGQVDDNATDGETWYGDFDGDGFGTPDYHTVACGNPEGYVKDTTDCDDHTAAVYPGAVEVCNGIDDNCDAVIDPSTSVGVDTWFIDGDGDGYATDDAAAVTQCVQPAGGVQVKGDCDDSTAEVLPGAAESCDGFDNDCDGVVDWGLRVPEDYTDLDDALANAVGGETVCLGAGTYVGNFSANGVDVTIEGAGSDVTTLDGNDTGPVFTVKNGETVTLKGVTLTNGKAAKGPGLYVDSSAFNGEDLVFEANEPSPTLSGNNLYTYGGVLYLSGAEVVFTDVTVDDHTIAPTFSGVSSSITQSQTSMYNYVYGGIAYMSGSVVQWNGGSISGNTISPSHAGRPSYTSTTTPYAYSYTYGGLIYASGAIFTASDLDISSNAITPSGSVTSAATTKYGYQYSYGSIAYLTSAILNWDGVDIDSNKMSPDATGNTYGYSYAYAALYAPSSSLTFDDVNFTNNTMKPTSTLGSTYAYYGLMYVTSGSVTWDNSEWSDNSFIGTSMLSGSSSYTGYAYLAYTSSTKVSSDGLTIDGNTVQVQTSGTGTGTPSQYCYGWYMYGSGYNLTLDHFKMTNNTVDCAQTTSTSVYTYPFLYMYYFNTGSSTLTNVLIANNTYKSSGTTYWYGFVVQDTYGDFTLENVSISYNTISTRGYNNRFGTIGLYGSSEVLTLVNTSIDNNTISNGGNTSLATATIMGASGGGSTITTNYSNFYNNTGSAGIIYNGTTATDPTTATGTTNVAVDPEYNDYANTDFTLASTSALIDAGDTGIEDTDGTTSDIGAYGGPGGDW